MKPLLALLLLSLLAGCKRENSVYYNAYAPAKDEEIVYEIRYIPYKERDWPWVKDFPMGTRRTFDNTGELVDFIRHGKDKINTIDIVYYQAKGVKRGEHYSLDGPWK